MSPNSDGESPPDAGAEPPPRCGTAECPRRASFYRFDREGGDWHPVCERHARTLHPSLEVHAWLESGYLRPVERGEPAGPPGPPAGERGAAFRDMVEEAMGWGE